ncbi:MAG: hypothetical protein ABI315_06630 [Bacteroidia bacterium]
MNRSIKKYSYIVLLILLITFFGYYRDYIFVSINAHLKALTYDVDSPPLPAILSFMKDCEYNTIIKIKWVLTFLFMLIYLGISLLALKLIFNNRNYYYIAIGLYMSITLVAGVFMVMGFLIKSTAPTMYEFSRYIMGLAQSPLILMILIPAFKLSKQETK